MIRLSFVAAAILVAAAASANAQDPASGEKTFLVCRACHQIGPAAKNSIGPVLNGIVGRTAGTYPGFAYSSANKESGIVWTPDKLDEYLTSPQTVVPHTKMIFPGIKNELQRKDVIAYLAQFNEDGTKKE